MIPSIFARVYITKGTAKIKHRIDLNYNMAFPDGKPFRVKIVEYPSFDDAVFINQKVENYQLVVNTSYISKKKYFDVYSNDVTDILFKPIKKRGRYNTISYEISFFVTVDYNVWDLDSQQSLPISDNEYSLFEHQYIKNGYCIHIDNRLRSFVKKITRRTREVSTLVQLLSIWINENIETVSFTKEQFNNLLTKKLNNAEKDIFFSYLVWANRKGTFFGKLNLLAAMLRSQNIPCRMVKGLVTGNNFVLVPDDISKETYYWLEVYIQNYSWMPVDINRTALMLFPGYIKERIGDDLPSLTGFDPNVRIISEDFFYESTFEKEPDITILNSIDRLQSLFFLPPVNVKNVSWMLEDVLKKRDPHFVTVSNVIQSEHEGIYSKKADDIIFVYDKTKPLYAQRFLITDKKSLENIRLSLFTLNSSGGSLRVLILSNLSTNGIMLKSDSIAAADLNISLARFRNYTFSFKNEMKNNPDALTLLPGDYWIVPQVKGRTAVHWGLMHESTFNKDLDAYMINRDFSKTAIMEGDFSFKVNFKEEN
jgi:transglutaminase-like putative cysteine protease